MDEQALQLIRRVGKLYSGDPALRCRVTVDTRFVGANDANRHRVQADYAIAQDHRLALRMQDVDRPERVLEVRSDGERLITHVPGLSQYTESPAPTTREELNDAVMQFGHANTGALMQNLLRDDPESMLLETATHCEYVGQETLPGGVAHHVRCHQPDLNWDLWVADGDRPLALRFRTTRVTALMTEVTDESVDDWQIGGEPDAASFSISLPEGTKKVDEFSS